MENRSTKEIFISSGEDSFEKHDDVKGRTGDIWASPPTEGTRSMYASTLITLVVSWYSQLTCTFNVQDVSLFFK